MYAATSTRPDIAYAVGQLCQVCHRPRTRHLEAVKRVFRYLLGTLNQCLHYSASGGMFLEGFTDADWAGDVSARRSTSGWVFRLAGGPVTWSSKQSTANSSCEVEYIALSAGVKECIWLRDLCMEFGVPQTKPTPIYCDNESAVKLTRNPEFHARTKHIAVAFHFAREQQRSGVILAVPCNTTEQGADYLTKPLALQPFLTCRERVGQAPPPDTSRGSVKSG